MQKYPMLSIRLSAELLRELHRVAESMHVSVSEVARIGIKRYLSVFEGEGVNAEVVLVESELDGQLNIDDVQGQ